MSLNFFFYCYFFPLFHKHLSFLLPLRFSLSIITVSQFLSLVFVSLFFSFVFFSILCFERERERGVRERGRRNVRASLGVLLQWHRCKTSMPLQENTKKCSSISQEEDGVIVRRRRRKRKK
jgi:hypothetical protein